MVQAPAPVRVRPLDLVLRCYARRSGRDRNKWVAHCIDLDLWAVGGSCHQARVSLEDAIRGYVEVVIDTKEPESIPPLLKRRAPFRYRVLWYLLAVWSLITRDGGPLDWKRYEEPVPTRIAIA